MTQIYAHTVNPPEMIRSRRVFLLFIQNRSAPVECRYTVYIDDCDDDGNGVFEQRFLPFLYFQAVACIGFPDEAVPAPSDPVTAEEGENKGSQRQDVSGDDEVPEVQPGRSIRKRLEVQQTEPESCCQGQGRYAYATNQTPLWTRPASQLADHCKYVFTYAQDG